MRPEPAAVFQAPWEAQIFALVVQLGERGAFTWKEWAETLGAVIREAQAAGDPDLGDTCYRHWVRALERLLSRKGLADEGALAARAARIEEEAQHRREAQLGAGRRRS